MAIFLYKFRNVRTKHSTAAAGTAGSPVSHDYWFYHEGSTAPTAAQAKVVLDHFIDSLGYVGPNRPNISVAMAAGHADTTARTNANTGKASFRIGKAVYQYAVAYHASTVAGALAANTTWKNLS
jgi:hypothetical protein